MLHEGGESFVGLRTLRTVPNIIGYYSTKDLINKSSNFHILNEIWDAFSSAFERHIMPESLRETLLSLANPEISAESFLFQDRLKTLLCSNLDVSWLEMTGLRWHSVIESLKVNHPKAVAPNTTLVQISDICKYPPDIANPIELLKSKESLPARIAYLISYLDGKRGSGELSNALQHLATQAKPGAPALLRHIAAQKENILSIASEIASDDRSRATG